MSFEKTIEKLVHTVTVLERRVQELEHALRIQADKPPDLPVSQNTIPDEKMEDSEKIDLENFSGASQLGWLGIVISLICTFIFVHYSFKQAWITGIGQPLILLVLGLVLFVVGDKIRQKTHPKFGAFLALLSAGLLFLGIYWSHVRVAATSSSFVLLAALGLWAALFLWSILRDSSLFLILGIAGAILVPVFVVDDFIGNNYLIYYFLLVNIVSFVFSLIKNRPLPSLIASLSTHVFIFIFIRHVNLSPDNQTSAVLFMTSFFPALFVLWSGLVALHHNRATTPTEKFTWVLNNLVGYIYIFAYWTKFNQPVLLLIPPAVNSVLYFTSWFKNNRQTHEFLYLLGVVISTAIALTVLMPIPTDVMMLCLFAVLLGHYANKEDGWHLKSVSGGMIIWSLIFLFAMRFHFTVQEGTPFINLRFSSFVIAFLCFAYQGVMINNDTNAKEMGPILGQGLLCLGLSVLLAGLGSEVMHAFPAGPEAWISQPALLSLTLLGGAFAFCVAYAGLVFKLFYVRILSVLFFLILVAKLLIFDLLKLDLPYLVISLASVAVLLGATSILLKKKKTT